MKKMTRRGVVATLGVAGAGICVCGMNEGCATFTKKGRTPAMEVAAYVIVRQLFPHTVHHLGLPEPD